DERLLMGVALLAGPVGAHDKKAHAFLRDVCARSESWRVQEMVAKGLEWLCRERGWAESEQVLKVWLSSDDPRARRAAVEGPRVWTERDFFADHPDRIFGLLALVRDDPDASVRRSVSNSLSDISKAEPDLVIRVLREWSIRASAPRWEIIKNACRHLRAI